MIKQIFVPQINVNDADVTIADWLVPSGAFVERAQLIAVLETNKTAQDIEAEEEGYLYYCRESKDMIAVGDLLALISALPLNDLDLTAAFDAAGTMQHADDQRSIQQAMGESAQRQVTAKARKLIEKHGLTLEDFPKDGKITVETVGELIARQRETSSLQIERDHKTAEPVAKSTSETKTVPNFMIEVDTPKRKQQEIEALVGSYHQIVPSEVTVSVSAGRVVRKLASLSKQHEFPFTLGDIACYDCARLLGRYPELNGYFHSNRTYRHRDINIGYALNFGKGLRVPVLRNADKQELTGVAQGLREFILKYAQDEIANKDCSQGSFTITDLSTSNVLTFRPVVSPMQSAILGIGKDPESDRIILILAFDHRMADGLVAARFLNELKVMLEDDGVAEGDRFEPSKDFVAFSNGAARTNSLAAEWKDSELRTLLMNLKERRISYAEFRDKAKQIEESCAVYPLSDGQKGLWVMQKLTPEFSAYNVPICFKWHRVLDVNRLQDAANCVLQQYPVLTQVILEEKGMLVQAAQPAVRIRVGLERIPTQSQHSLQRRLKDLTKIPFVLDEGPLLRINVLSRREDEHVVLITVHHIICDGVSCGLLLQALMENYRTLSNGQRPALVARAASYRDFVAWEQTWRNDEAAVSREWSYWRQQLASPLPICALPTDRPRRSIAGFNGDSVIVALRNELCERIRSVALIHKLRPSAVYLGLFKLLLHHLSGQLDLIVGMPITGRPEQRFESVFGNFINMIAIRSVLSMEQSLLATLQNLQLTIISGLYHGSLPFAELVKRLDVARTESYSPVFQVAYMYHEFQNGHLEDAPDRLDMVEDLVQEGQYELTLEIRETERAPVFYWKYDPDLFDVATIERMSGIFARLVENVSSNADLSLADYLRIAIENDHARQMSGAIGHSFNGAIERVPNVARAGTAFATESVTGRVVADQSPTMVHSPTVEDDEPSSEYPKLREALVAIWKTLLRVDSVSADLGFFEAGGTSVTSVLMVEKIAKTFACEFTITLLFRYPTINKMAAYLDKQLHNVVHARTEPRPIASQNTASELQGIPQEPNAGRNDGSLPNYYRDSVAIIGMSCEFPGARNHREFWSNLVQGAESAQFFSDQELRGRGVSEELIRDRLYVPVASSMQGKDLFDAEFFNISVQSAELMDPQLRLLLLHSWRAVEDAGYKSADIPSTSVIMTANNASYHAPLFDAERGASVDPLQRYLMSQGGTIPTSISYYLGLKGPSIFLHTNCSSSLVAVHSAYLHLRLNETKYALVGGAGVYSRANIGYVHRPGSNLSSDGHCRPFDSAADGMTLGEGVGAILIKRAIEAIEDNDHIYAILRGIGVNNDGTEKVGFYAPSVAGQSALITQVLNATGVDPNSIDFVEASATGSRLGDPIEVVALHNAYRAYTERKQYCALGSVKSNIGHLDSAAGIAGVIKVVLSLHHGEIPPSINFDAPNSEIDFAESPFFVVAARRQLAAKATPHRGALSSFGIGGTNSHAIFEEFKAPRAADPTADGIGKPSESIAVILSAKKPEALRQYASSLLEYLQLEAIYSLDSIAFTLQLGRTAFAYRAAFIVKSVDELIACLRRFVRGEEVKSAQMCTGTVGGGRERQQWLEGDDSKELIQQWIADRQVLKLAECWVNGAHVDWRKMYGISNPPRVSLPTYPFARRAYWLDGTRTLAASAVTPNQNQQASVPAARFSDANSFGEIDAIPLSATGKVAAFLRQSIASIKQCSIADVDTTLGFFEMGLTSYGLLEVIVGLETALQEKLSPLILFEHATPDELATYLHRNYGMRCEALTLTRVLGSQSPAVIRELQREHYSSLVASELNRNDAKAVDLAVEQLSDVDDATDPEIFLDFRRGDVSVERMLAMLKEHAV